MTTLLWQTVLRGSWLKLTVLRRASLTNAAAPLDASTMYRFLSASPRHLGPLHVCHTGNARSGQSAVDTGYLAKWAWVARLSSGTSERRVEQVWKHLGWTHMQLVPSLRLALPGCCHIGSRSADPPFELTVPQVAALSQGGT